VSKAKIAPEITAAITVSSPVGPLRLEAAGESLARVWFHDRHRVQPPPGRGILAETARQLDAYFDGNVRAFDLDLAPHGTPFQLDVWHALLRIPYGETTTYSDLAVTIGRPAAVRAVGAANGSNPIPIIVPCHRVIGRDGTLVGFGGGIDMKRTLLALERGGALF
jgi:methylated-DNA-[protein]-cysteine S-methyltransferase